MRKRTFKAYHLILVPYDKTGGKSMLFTAKTLKTMTLLLTLIVAISAILISLHTKNYFNLRTTLFPTLSKNSILTEKNMKIAKEKLKMQSTIDSLATQLYSERAIHKEKLKSLNIQAKRIKRFAENLRIMAGFRLEPREAQPPGLGGPLPEEEDIFLKSNDIEDEEIIESFCSAENQLHKKYSSSSGKLKSLWKYFENKNSIIAGTPELQPVPGRIISGFGYRINPFTGGSEFHKGVDIPAPIGTKIKSPATGVVIFAGRRGGYGKLVEVDHGNNYKTVYGHLHSFDVAVGDRLNQGDFIGEVGSTGRSTGPHLHYEVRLNNVPVNPVQYFKSVADRKKEYEENPQVEEKDSK